MGKKKTTKKRDPEICTFSSSDCARIDGKKHTLLVFERILFSLLLALVETGQIDPILIERYNTPGFVGCLSRVQLNGVAPLKAALRSGQAAPVSAHGILVPSNCGASPLTVSPLAADDPWHVESGNSHGPVRESRQNGAFRRFRVHFARRRSRVSFQ